MSGTILTLNAGSSSIKFGLFAHRDGEPEVRASGEIERIGEAPRLVARDARSGVLLDRRWDHEGAPDYEGLLGELLDWLSGNCGTDQLIGVGHRVVHGGARFSSPIRATPSVLDELEALCPLAPLHQRHNLTAIRAVTAVRPDVSQVACFDTAFHHGQPEVATRFALPQALEAEGVRRYGFHGLSYEYVSRQLVKSDTALGAGRVIVAHLGSGASLCAMAQARSVDTTMSFTALDGLVMSTRCGSIDPGVLLYLMQEKAMAAEEVQHLLYEQAGLLGVSGISGDMKVLLESEDPRARAAIDLFNYRLVREAGSLAASLGGLDGLVFTGGIGENAPEIRADACRRLAWLGVELDNAANLAGKPVISLPGSRVTVRVIPTNEELMIAIHTLEVLDGSAKRCRPISADG